jgi:hypothetical protein
LPESVLPALTDVAKALAALIGSGEIFPHTLASLARAGIGLAIAVVAGIATRHRDGARARRPPRVRAVPAADLPGAEARADPLFMIWLGIGDFSKIAVIALGCSAAGRHRRVQRRAQHRRGAALVGGARAVSRNGAALARGAARHAAADRGRRPHRARDLDHHPRQLGVLSAQEGLGYLISNYGGVGADDAMLGVGDLARPRSAISSTGSTSRRCAATWPGMRSPTELGRGQAALARILPIGGFLLAWELVARTGLVNPFVFPPVTEIVIRWVG